MRVGWTIRLTRQHPVPILKLRSKVAVYQFYLNFEFIMYPKKYQPDFAIQQTASSSNRIFSNLHFTKDISPGRAHPASKSPRDPGSLSSSTYIPEGDSHKKVPKQKPSAPREAPFKKRPNSPFYPSSRRNSASSTPSQTLSAAISHSGSNSVLQDLPHQAIKSLNHNPQPPQPSQRSVTAVNNAIRQKIYTNLTRNLVSSNQNSLRETTDRPASDKKTSSFIETEEVNRSFNSSQLSHKGSQLLKVVQGSKQQNRAYQIKKFPPNGGSNVQIGVAKHSQSSKFGLNMDIQNTLAGVKSLAGSANASQTMVNNFIGAPHSVGLPSAVSSTEGNTQRSGTSIRSKKPESESELSPKRNVAPFQGPTSSTQKSKKQTTSSILQNANQRALQSLPGGGGQIFTNAAEQSLRREKLELLNKLKQVTLQMNSEKQKREKAEAELQKIKKELLEFREENSSELKELQLKLKGYQVFEKAFEIEKKQKEDTLQDLKDLRFSFTSCKAQLKSIVSTLCELLEFVLLKTTFLGPPHFVGGLSSTINHQQSSYFDFMNNSNSTDFLDRSYEDERKNALEQIQSLLTAKLQTVQQTVDGINLQNELENVQKWKIAEAFISEANSPFHNSLNFRKRRQSSFFHGMGGPHSGLGVTMGAGAGDSSDRSGASGSLVPPTFGGMMLTSGEAPRHHHHYSASHQFGGTGQLSQMRSFGASNPDEVPIGGLEFSQDSFMKSVSRGDIEESKEDRVAGFAGLSDSLSGVGGISAKEALSDTPEQQRTPKLMNEDSMMNINMYFRNSDKSNNPAPMELNHSADKPRSRNMIGANNTLRNKSASPLRATEFSIKEENQSGVEQKNKNEEMKLTPSHNKHSSSISGNIHTSSTKRIPTKEEEELVIAKHTFAPQKENDLGFQAGDIIILEKKRKSGWWIGRLKDSGRRGFFPHNYVQEYRRGPSQEQLSP